MDLRYKLNHARELTPDLMLLGYSNGFFPMFYDPKIEWFRPNPRAILPLPDGFHVSRSFKRVLNKTDFSVTFDQNFSSVLENCHNPAVRGGEDELWLSEEMKQVWLELYKIGYAHSVEVVDGINLVGGVYGLALGSAFFADSMFSHAEDASKIGLYYLVQHLNTKGFTLFDTQYINDHTRSLGVINISGKEFKERLKLALDIKILF